MKSLNGRALTRAAALLAAGAAFIGIAGRAVAEPAFPNRTVTIVVPFNAGGGTDASARAIAKGLAQIWGQSVIVTNVGGADGLIGTQRVARSAADGYTVVVSVPNLLLFKYSKNDGNYDALGALQPVSLIARYPVVLIASNASGIKTVADLKTKCADGQCSWGSGEQFSWLAGQSMLDAVGVKAVNVPYRGTGPVTNDVLGGHVTLGVGALASPLPHYKAGNLKIIAGLGDKRSTGAPDVPTLAEAGVQGVSISAPWYGLFAPKGVPAEVLNAWQEGLKKLQKDPGVAQALETLDATPVLSGPVDFDRQVHAEQTAYDGLIKVHPLPQ